MAELTLLIPDDLEPFEMKPGDFLLDLSEYLRTWFGDEALIVHPEEVTEEAAS